METTISREELINHAQLLHEQPSEDVEWCPPEMLEAHPLGFFIRPYESFCLMQDTGEVSAKVAAFCAPEIDVDMWSGPVVVGLQVDRDDSVALLAASQSSARQYYGDDLVYIVAVPWFGVTAI